MDKYVTIVVGVQLPKGVLTHDDWCYLGDMTSYQAASNGTEYEYVGRRMILPINQKVNIENQQDIKGFLEQHSGIKNHMDTFGVWVVSVL